MAGVRFADLQARPMEFLDFTSVTLDEFQQLVAPFEAAFHARMAAWRMDGETADLSPVYRVQKLSPPDTGRSALVHTGLPQNLCPPGSARALVRDGPGQS
jgi:hypothetical protein